MWRGFKSCGSHCGHPSLGKAEGDLSRQANEKNGIFALRLAAGKGHEAMVRVLLEAGADAKQVSSAECRGAESGRFWRSGCSARVMIRGLGGLCGKGEGIHDGF